jgi:hypothetical protein
MRKETKCETTPKIHIPEALSSKKYKQAGLCPIKCTEGVLLTNDRNQQGSWEGQFKEIINTSIPEETLETIQKMKN